MITTMFKAAVTTTQLPRHRMFRQPVVSVDQVSVRFGCQATHSVTVARASAQLKHRNGQIVNVDQNEHRRCAWLSPCSTFFGLHTQSLTRLTWVDVTHLSLSLSLSLSPARRRWLRRCSPGGWRSWQIRLGGKGVLTRCRFVRCTCVMKA